MFLPQVTKNNERRVSLPPTRTNGWVYLSAGILDCWNIQCSGVYKIQGRKLRNACLFHSVQQAGFRVNQSQSQSALPLEKKDGSLVQNGWESTDGLEDGVMVGITLLFVLLCSNIYTCIAFLFPINLHYF
jgi:hypothetical protein